jgi:hypothetical protein
MSVNNKYTINSTSSICFMVFCLRKIRVTFIFCWLSFLAYGQSPEDAVKTFFMGMRTSDTLVMKSVIVGDMKPYTLLYIDEKNTKVQSGVMGTFYKFIATTKPGELDERISNIKTLQSGDIAAVTMDYAFYFKGQFSHSGVNLFALIRHQDHWLITSIQDTHKK